MIASRGLLRDAGSKEDHDFRLCTRTRFLGILYIVLVALLIRVLLGGGGE